VKRFAERSRRQHIGTAKFEIEIRGSRLFTRRVNGAPHKIHPDHLEAGCRKINRVGACSTAEVERTPRTQVFAFNQLYDLRRCDVGVPRRLTNKITPMKN